MYLGYFADFKGTKSVLLSCNAHEIAELRAALRNVMDYKGVLAVHQIHGVRVYVAAAPSYLH